MPDPPRLRVVDGLLVLEYPPTGRPDRLEIPADLFELIVTELNQYRRIATGAGRVNGAARAPVLEFVAEPVVPSPPSD